MTKDFENMTGYDEVTASIPVVFLNFFTHHSCFYHSTETQKPCSICFVKYQVSYDRNAGLCVSSVSLYSNAK